MYTSENLYSSYKAQGMTWFKKLLQATLECLKPDGKYVEQKILNMWPSVECWSPNVSWVVAYPWCRRTVTFFFSIALVQFHNNVIHFHNSWYKIQNSKHIFNWLSTTPKIIHSPFLQDESVFYLEIYFTLQYMFI